ncbi:MAG: hypothetical protein MK180_11945 [Rhodobacteraceae bacterium]|nr:hypothetical protein [Paracoccaceae bacterium]
MQTSHHEVPPKGPPRIALMGEFSAGKSTLANLLLGCSASPVMATPTQLPPIWYRAGQGCRYINADNKEVPLDFARINELGPDDAKVVFSHLDARILNVAEVIDFPGSSDPNMNFDSWEMLFPQIDMVFWCTPANQAWRQSEAALWQEMPEKLRTRSALLVTRMDQVTSETERMRLLRRIECEAAPEFGSVVPVSLVGNADGSDGGYEGLSGVLELIQRWCTEIEAEARMEERAPLDFTPVPRPPARTPSRPLRPLEPGTIVPRRVFPASGGRS